MVLARWLADMDRGRGELDEQGAQEGAPFSHRTQRGRRPDTALHEAVRVGDLNAARALVDDRVDPNHVSRLSAPLIIAAQHAPAGMTALLLNAGADPRQASHTGETALHAAAARGDLGIVRLLLERGGDPNAGSGQGVSLLYDHPTVTLGERPAHLAAAYGHDAVLAVLADAGADLTAPDRSGRTPYDWAVRHRAPTTEAWLRAHHGADDADEAEERAQ